MSANPSPLKVFFLDVGQGDCTFIVPPAGEGAPILFDCNDAYVAERFVADHGLTDLHAVVASHLDHDHIGGLLTFLCGHFTAERRVERLYLLLDRIVKPSKDEALRKLVEHAMAWEERPPHEGFGWKAGHRDADGPLMIATGPDWRVELVLPWLGDVTAGLLTRDPNRSSSVLRVTRAGSSILIGGDAPLRSWERLEPMLQPADVIRTPHHGGALLPHGVKWQVFSDLYDAVGAGTAITSVGTNNQHHPVPAHLAAMRRGAACRVLCTQLTERCDSDPLAMREDAVRRASGVEYPYRHRAVPGHVKKRPATEVPCAGTVVVSIDSEGRVEVLPEPGGWHKREQLADVERALCVRADLAATSS